MSAIIQIQSSSPTLPRILHVRNPRTLELEGKCSDEHKAPSKISSTFSHPSASLSSYRNNLLASLIPHISPKPHIANWLEEYPPQLANKLLSHPANIPPQKIHPHTKTLVAHGEFHDQAVLALLGEVSEGELADAIRAWVNARL